MLDAMVGKNIGDPLSFDKPNVSFLEYLKKEYSPISICASEDLGIVPVDKEVRSVFRKGIKMIESYTWKINYDIPCFSGILDAFKTLRGVLMASMLGDLVSSKKEYILDDITKNVQVGFDARSYDIIEAEKKRHKLLLNMEKFFILLTGRLIKNLLLVQVSIKRNIKN